MEHRYSRRQRQKVNAKLYISNRLIETTYTRDICENGLFLKLSRQKVARTTLCRIVLSTQLVNVSWMVGAMVIHSNSNGIGLVLENDVPESFFELPKVGLETHKVTHARYIDWQLSE